MVGVWLIVLASSSTPYGKVPRLILKKTSRRTQAVVVSEGIFCAARCCVFFYLQSMKVYLHMSNGNVQQNLFMPSILSLRIFTSRPGSRLRFYIKIEIQYQQILQKVQNSVPHDYIKPYTVFVYTVVQQYVLVDCCCFHLTSGASTAVGPYIIPRNRKGFFLSQTTLREKFVDKKVPGVCIVGPLIILVKVNLFPGGASLKVVEFWSQSLLYSSH